MKRSVRWALVLGTLGVILAIGAPDGVTAEAWRLFAIFAATTGIFTVVGLAW